MKSFRTTIRLGMVGLSIVESRKGNKEAKATLHVCAVVMVFTMKMNPQGICRLRKASKTALVGAAEDGLGQRARFSKPFKELRMATSTREQRPSRPSQSFTMRSSARAASSRCPGGGRGSGACGKKWQAENERASIVEHPHHQVRIIIAANRPEPANH
jgi:hypothetical protein